MKIIPKTDQYNELVRNDIVSEFGSAKIVSIRRVYEDAALLPGFIAEDAHVFAGALLYSIEENECELVYLHATRPGMGTGSMLVDELIKMLEDKKPDRLWVITTNDNTEALVFYQKRWFQIVKVYAGAMDRVRKIKPLVPLTGKHGIPLRDMIELEIKFESA